MQTIYDFYYGLTNVERRSRALEGIKTGALRVQDLRSEPRLLAATVVSDSGHTYTIRVDWNGLSCDCPDFSRRCADHKRPCKHLLAAMITDQAAQVSRQRTSQEEGRAQREKTRRTWARRRKRWQLFTRPQRVRLLCGFSETTATISAPGQAADREGRAFRKTHPYTWHEVGTTRTWLDAHDVRR